MCGMLSADMTVKGGRDFTFVEGLSLKNGNSEVRLLLKRCIGVDGAINHSDEFAHLAL